MDTKTLSIIIVFTAVTMALAISGFAVPAFFATYLFFQIWEIPIVTAFTLISRKSAIVISILNAVVLVTVFPGASPIGPFYNLIATLSMLFGIFIIQKSFKNKELIKNKKNKPYYSRFVVLSTISGIIFRVVTMTIVNYLVLRLPIPFGFEFLENEIIATLPLIGAFNAILAAYTIPIGLFITKAISKNLKLN